MFRLLRGLGHPPVGESNAQGRGGPPPILTRGLGGRRPQTARPENFCTPVFCWHVSTELPADPGSVPVNFGGEPLLVTAPDGTASPNPYLNGVPQQTDPAVPADCGRLGDNGSPEYAVINPTPHTPYNGRSLQVYLPEGLFPAPRALDRLEYLLRAHKGETAYTLVRRTGGPVLLEIADLAEDDS